MTFRLLLPLIWPLSLTLDLLWSGIDPEHQTLVDRLASTYVVRRDSSPAGSGPIHLSCCFAFGLALRFSVVVRPSEKTLAA